LIFKLNFLYKIDAIKPNPSGFSATQKVFKTMTSPLKNLSKIDHYETSTADKTGHKSKKMSYSNKSSVSQYYAKNTKNEGNAAQVLSEKAFFDSKRIENIDYKLDNLKKNLTDANSSNKIYYDINKTSHTPSGRSYIRGIRSASKLDSGNKTQKYTSRDKGFSNGFDKSMDAIAEDDRHHSKHNRIVPLTTMKLTDSLSTKQESKIKSFMNVNGLNMSYDANQIEGRNNYFVSKKSSSSSSYISMKEKLSQLQSDNEQLMQTK
jgi:hypothetical protein